jgi:hypothetical protein
MAEVLLVAGGVASTAQILSTAVKSYEILTKFCHDFHDAPMELARIRDNVCILKTSLNEIQAFLNIFPDDTLLPPDLRQVLSKAFSLVQVDIDALGQIKQAQAIGGRMSSWKQLS